MEDETTLRTITVENLVLKAKLIANGTSVDHEQLYALEQANVALANENRALAEKNTQLSQQLSSVRLSLQQCLEEC